MLLLFSSSCSNEILPIPPVEPLPNEYQLAWQELEYYGFIHFNMNTFTNKEWGYGDEIPAQFNPSELDARQWARVAKEAGMKGLIITAKHHDGFSLWPSAYTEHSVKNSPWKEGKGDLIQELSDACKEFGLKFGVYLSPWDRNHADYGKKEYVDYYRNQLRELLTNYGPIFEVWFDGANGGDGFYGGANEERRVEKRTYYEWPTTIDLVRDLQPKAVIFSDAGPDIRWVGNERGYAYDTTWSPILRDSVYAGMPGFDKYAKGQ
ncbi:MAG: alpha-L-fucosidase, partial [Flavobacteriaceae bacterium]|nr:alpha-L-fucosidase [Flavobacteriaceae bacterium]